MLVTKDAVFNTLSGNYLYGYDMLNLTVTSPADCLAVCLENFPSCVSVNYNYIDNLCMLNHGTHKEFNYRLLPNVNEPVALPDIDNWGYMYNIKY